MIHIVKTLRGEALARTSCSEEEEEEEEVYILNASIHIDHPMSFLRHLGRNVNKSQEYLTFLLQLIDIICQIKFFELLTLKPNGRCYNST